MCGDLLWVALLAGKSRRNNILWNLKLILKNDLENEKSKTENNT